MAESLSLEKVIGSPMLPSLPEVAVQILELTRDEAVQVQDIARVVQNDQALSAKILKTVNSSYYGLSRPCPTVLRALAYLGLNTVKSLVLGFSLVDWVDGDEDGLNLQAYWRRSIYSAAAARRLGLHTGCCDPDEAFMAALMQDIGVMAIHCAAGKLYARVLAAAGGDHARLTGQEHREFGFTHAEAGAALAEKWRLPEQIVEPIRCHHVANRGSLKHPHLVRTVALSYQIATVLTVADPADGMARLTQRAQEWLDLSAEAVQELVTQIAREAGELASLFRVNTSGPADIDTILSEARERSLEYQLATQREADELRHSNQQLARRAVTDGLTGLANRRHFDLVLNSRLEEARAANGCVGLIFVDVDRFKALNDTYGHQIGDAVLMELARRLEEIVGTDGLVARYGGEEFTIIVTDGDRRRTTAIAEKIRRNLESREVDVSQMECGLDSVPVTASFGVAAREPECAAIFTSGEILVHAADKAVYKAKQDGRNCVRVFRPKVPIKQPAPSQTAT